MNECSLEPLFLKPYAPVIAETNLSRHLGACAICEEIDRAARWMGSLARSLDVDGPLPDPGLVWLKARVLGREVHRERALLPLKVVQAGRPSAASPPARPSGRRAFFRRFWARLPAPARPCIRRRWLSFWH